MTPDNRMAGCTPAQPVVSFVTLVLTHYRVPFHERMRARLAQSGVDYRLIYSGPTGDASAKRDTADLAWATKVPVHRLPILGNNLFWQNARRLTRGSDLTIVSQENKLLLNHWLLARSWLGGGRVAFFGHGRNRQSVSPDGVRERLKRHMATRADWWFAYTPAVRDLVAGYGYPESRITVTDNAIDTSALISDLALVDDDDIAETRRTHGIQGRKVGLYMGGLYAEKRLGMLIEAAGIIRQRVPDFELLVAGSGPDAALVDDAARRHPFIHAVGPVFGRDKARLLKLASAWLLPGAVGLAVLDSFAAGCPLVTMNDALHGPEVDYLDNGYNGLIVAADGGVEAYADAVAGLIEDETGRTRLAESARASARLYTIDRMVENTARGVLDAIGRVETTPVGEPAANAGSA